MDYLETSIDQVKGVGPQTLLKLNAAGIKTVADLLYFLPRKYEDFSKISNIRDIEPGNVVIKAEVTSVVQRRVRRGLHITEAVVEDKTGSLRAIWFNQPYRPEQLKHKGKFFIAGTYGFLRDRYVLQNPSVEKVTDLPLQTNRVIPVYREIKGLKSHQLRKILGDLKSLITMVPDPLPEAFVKQQKLLSLSDALMSQHFPAKTEDADEGRRRLAFDELLVLLLSSLRNKHENMKLNAWKIPFNETAAKDFVAKLPFKLTNAQRVALWEIVKNFEKGQPMNRLLQGDVGAGKTVVAGMAAYMAGQEGYQTAILAPTEVLARQHAETLSKLLEPFNMTVGLLVGGIKPKAKKQLKDSIKAGAVTVTIGTHALLQDDVEFNQLGFVVIDEQHRFGVEQRQQLLKKSKRMPHLLSMTATPIPRSLALTVYGELDVSILNERPKGRKEIITKIHSPNSRAQLYDEIDQQLNLGRQAYVVCPVIDENGEISELKSVTEEHKRLKASIFKHRRIGLLHGQMKPDEKDFVMSSFAAGELDILVTTTVIEVGVDVPNATVMMIEGADRFGLAQLHQLRGRVGRSEHQSYCYLIPSTSKKPSKRLSELAKSNDGFYLAEVDLKLRGPGAIYGKAQHGALDLRIATLTDTKLIKQAKAAASKILEQDPELLQYKQLKSRVDYYQRLTTLN